MAKETDADFICLTQQKLFMAKCKLEEKTKEFAQEILLIFIVGSVGSAGPLVVLLLI